VKRGLVIREWRLARDSSAKKNHLEIDIPGLSAINGPLSVDDEDGDATDTTLAQLLDLIVDRLSVLVRIDVCDGLGIVEGSGAIRNGSLLNVPHPYSSSMTPLRSH
jgi:hypothetical protein